ncbi:hypothetical protein, partial [Staphylococcus epidermidis]|uniref:hypothetical protein n=1 Tax=Staphylococcus epidermidis TaxID=1282 RepID=UPI001E40D889
RAENIQKKYKKDNFYIISIEIVFFHLSRYFMSRTHFFMLFYIQHCTFTLLIFLIHITYFI